MEKDMIPLNDMTENDFWSECRRMWTDVVAWWNSNQHLSIIDLKWKWLIRNNYIGDNKPACECFFCEMSKRGSKIKCHLCPGRKIDSEFDCQDSVYHYRDEPEAFLAKIIEMDEIRKSK